MPSPFPGMDPFLELPLFFPGLHDRIIDKLSDALQAQLPAPYFADIRDRVTVEFDERRIEPDVNILHGESPSEGMPFFHETNGGTAVAEATRTQPLIIQVPHDEHRETFLEIYAGGEHERLVATIEVLSPSNKTPGEQGRDLYLRKQREVLESRVHLVEIDLLRGGRHTTAVPEDRLKARSGSFDYQVCIHRWHRFGDFAVYTIQLEEKLPTIDIPLLPPDPPVAIDLQAVFDRCYDTGPYRRRVRYAELTPQPELTPARLAWVRERLAAVPTQP